ncbi:hypothetical protein C1752_03705 [Acaryochloris thomasi RCC1774]|uniref:Uncharacterized protein n=1 Tax=Acaryochloris thomasi RCC1774 TaxID=1764569 RepID=A0A2W1JNT3_9CYAN|nr:hypothetical protein [Acaryochloris thomasi]PZD72532.1 hypothetical protein C1752_03705 [Acaryochloris thomasi RCC1774]
MTAPAIPNASDAPRWLQTLQYTFNPLESMDQAAVRCGDLFNAPVIGKHAQVLFVSHPEAIQKFFPATPKN